MDRKLLYRKHSLNHYYNNIEKYREYYRLNKARLMKYNTEYKRIRRIINRGVKPNYNKTVLIEHAKFIVVV
jgi:hypothetical protein